MQDGKLHKDIGIRLCYLHIDIYRGEMYNKLTNEIEELNERKGTIKAKVATAKMQERINKMGSSISNSKSSLDSFSRMEEKANKMLDEANAMAELNSMPSDEIDDLMNKYNISRNTLKKYIEYIANKKCI